MTLIRIIKKWLVPISAGVAALLAVGVALAVLLDQWRWAALLSSASVICLAAIGGGIFLRQGELLRLQQREAARARRVEDRRRRFERRQLTSHHLDDSVQRVLLLLGDRSDLRTDLLEQTVLASARAIRDDIIQSCGGCGVVEDAATPMTARLGDDAGPDLSRRLSRDVRQHLRDHEQDLLAELDALHQIHRRFPIDGSVPLVGHFALSPAGLLQLLNLASSNSVRTIVECGTGVSTVYLAWLLREEPRARLISIEHEPAFARATIERLRQLELDDLVEVRLAPLEPLTVGGWSGLWYAVSALDDLNAIDLLLVDGPPGSTGEQARYPAMPVFESRMSPMGIIILDDVNRSQERSVLNGWLDIGGWEPGLSSTKRQAILHRTDGV